MRRSERHGEEAGARGFELVAHSGEEIFFKEEVSSSSSSLLRGS